MTHTSVELKEVNCCASCDHFEMYVATLDRIYSCCNLHKSRKYNSMIKDYTDAPLDVEPYNICKDFADDE